MRSEVESIARGAAGGPDRLAVVQLDPLAPAELLGQIDFRGLDAQPLGVGDGCDAGPRPAGGPAASPCPPSRPSRPPLRRSRSHPPAPAALRLLKRGVLGT